MAAARPLGADGPAGSGWGAGVKYRVVASGRSFLIEIDHERLVWVDGNPLYLELEQVGGLPVYSLSLDDAGYMLFVEEGQESYRVEVQGQIYPVSVETTGPQLPPRTPGDGSRQVAEATIRAPLAGYLTTLPLLEGEWVAAGQVVAVVESMKMQMELKTPREGKIVRVNGPQGRDVTQGEALVTVSAAS
jgi:biotin carboxyl carrier protein